jgi:hypothetical protein
MSEAAKLRGSVLDPATERQLKQLDTSLDSLKASFEALKLQMIASVGISLEPLVTGIDKFHKEMLATAKDPVVQDFMRAFLLLSGGWAPARVPAGPPQFKAGTPPFATTAGGGLGSITSMIPSAMATNMAIENAARNREKVENEYNEIVAKAKRDRERQEDNRQSFETIAIAHNRATPLITGTLISGPGVPTKDELQNKALEDAEKENKAFWDEVGRSIRKTRGEVKDEPKPGKTPQELELEKNKKATAALSTSLDVLSSSLRGASLAASFTSREFRSLVTSMVASVMALAAPALGPIGSVFSQIFSLFDAGGKVAPIGASTGLVTNGMRGRDSLHAMLGGGERVLSVRRNDRFEQMLDSLSTGRGNLGGGGSVTNHVSINVSVDPRMDARATERWVRGNVVPALRDEMGSGRFWNGA